MASAATSMEPDSTITSAHAGETSAGSHREGRGSRYRTSSNRAVSVKAVASYRFSLVNANDLEVSVKIINAFLRQLCSCASLHCKNAILGVEYIRFHCCLTLQKLHACVGQFAADSMRTALFLPSRIKTPST